MIFKNQKIDDAYNDMQRTATAAGFIDDLVKEIPPGITRDIMRRAYNIASTMQSERFREWSKLYEESKK